MKRTNKKRVNKKRKMMVIAVCILLLTGCVKDDNKPINTNTITTLPEESTTTKTDETPVVELPIEKPEPVNVEPDYSVVKPNEMGSILVVMYHGIFDNQPYHITPEQFRRDLLYMYENGYRLISMKDYLSGEIDIPAGMTPIVLTFDDGLPTTFSLEEKDGILVPVKDTAVYILEEFNETYPEFGTNAIFYVNPSNGMFTGAGTEQERLQWLVDHKYEVSTHTSTHETLGEVSKEVILKEMGGSIGKLHELLGDDYEMDSMSYPFGSIPQKVDLKESVLDGTYEDTTYRLSVGFAVGVSGPFVTSYNKKFNKYNAPRTRGSQGAVTDLWWTFEDLEKNPHKRYVSDGMINRLSVPTGYEENINKEALPEGMEIYLY